MLQTSLNWFVNHEVRLASFGSLQHWPVQSWTKVPGVFVVGVWPGVVVVRRWVILTGGPTGCSITCLPWTCVTTAFCVLDRGTWTGLAWGCWAGRGFGGLEEMKMTSGLLDLCWTEKQREWLLSTVFCSWRFNSLPIAALCDVINNTTQRSMEIFPSKPRTRCTRCDVAPQMTHRMQRIYRVCMNVMVCIQLCVFSWKWNEQYFETSI